MSVNVEEKKKSIHKITPNECRIKKKSYTTIPTETFRSIKNPKAAIIWAFLIGHSENWVVQKQHIKNQYGFSIRVIEDSYRELEKMGLMTCRPIRSESGKFIKHMWEVHSEPETTMLKNDIVEEVTELLEPEPSGEEKTTLLFSHTVAKRPLINNIYNINKKIKNSAKCKNKEEDMGIHYQNTIVAECKFVHQEKQFGEQGYYCTNPCQFKVPVEDEEGKQYDFDVCPRHEKMILQRGMFKYCGKNLKVVPKEK